MKYIRSAVVGKTVKILVMVVNTQNNSVDGTNWFLTSKLSGDIRYRMKEERLWVSLQRVVIVRTD